MGNLRSKEVRVPSWIHEKHKARLAFFRSLLDIHTHYSRVFSAFCAQEYQKIKAAQSGKTWVSGQSTRHSLGSFCFLQASTSLCTRQVAESSNISSQGPGCSQTYLFLESEWKPSFCNFNIGFHLWEHVGTIFFTSYCPWLAWAKPELASHICTDSCCWSDLLVTRNHPWVFWQRQLSSTTFFRRKTRLLSSCASSSYPIKDDSH